MSSERTLAAALFLVVISGCVDPCAQLVDKVCGPGESTARACWDSDACRDARDIRETTAAPVCSLALEDEEDYPRCPTCVPPPPSQVPVVPGTSEPACEPTLP